MIKFLPPSNVYSFTKEPSLGKRIRHHIFFDDGPRKWVGTYGAAETELDCRGAKDAFKSCGCVRVLIKSELG
jgi:hypothetical protein